MSAMIAAEVFRALADPTRRAVFEHLAGREMSVTQLKADFPISQPAISQRIEVSRGHVVRARSR